MKIVHETLNLQTKQQFQLLDVTSDINALVKKNNIKTGTVTVFNPHTTAVVRLNHNEPLLMQDIMQMLYRIVPIEHSYHHDLFEMRQEVDVNERSNGHAHVKAFLLGAASETVPINMGSMLLGERQSIFFVELDGGRARNLKITICGE